MFAIVRITGECAGAFSCAVEWPVGGKTFRVRVFATRNEALNDIDRNLKDYKIVDVPESIEHITSGNVIYYSPAE